MINKLFRIYILLAIFTAAGTLAFADQPSSSLDDKPSVDSAANAQVQAPAPPAGATAADTQSSYLYDLKKLIEKSRENIKEVNEKIKEQAVLKRNQKREERAREYYEKGLELTNEGKLDEAREYFEKAIRITEHPEMSGYIKESQRRLKRQEAALQAQENEHFHQIKQDENTRKEDVEAAYKEAVDLYKQKKYHPAKDAFEHVDEIAPDYRATDSYLKIIDQDIILADALAAKQQAVEIANQQKDAEVARAKEKAMWLSQIEEKEKERKEAINKQAAEVYDQAVELYKLKKFAEAKKKFEEVSWVIPDYKATMKYLSRIDHDAQVEQERVAQEQQKALQEQRWEQEVEKRKQEAQQQRELEAKELQHKKDLEEQAQFLYTAAVNLFDNKEMDEAFEKFNDIEKLLPGYRSTKMYLARIEQWKVDQQRRQLEAQQEAQRETARQKEMAEDRQRQDELRDKTDKAQNIYDQAMDSYRDHRWEESRAQFESVEQLVPDFKHTRSYLQKVEANLAVSKKSQTPAVEVSSNTQKPAPVVSNVKPSVVVVAAPVVPPSPVVVTQPAQASVSASLEDQEKQAQDIAALAEKSAQLYHQIADIADDSSTAQTKRKMAQVDEILNNLKENKQKLLRQMQEEQFKRQQEQEKAKEQEHKAEAEKMYHDGLEYFHSHEYSKAKIKFLELENIYPDYRGTRRYLDRIDDSIKKANVEAVTGYETSQAQHLKKLQDKENAVEILRAQEEQEKQLKIEEQQQASLKELAQKASSINDDIIRLSKEQDYGAMKEKFAELETTVTALMTLKDEMSKVKDQQEREKKLSRESIDQRANMLKAQRQESQQIQSYGNAQSLGENRHELSDQINDADHYKRREVIQEQNMLFTEGVDRYEHKKYTQAKLLFGELAAQHDRRAESWLKKVDRAITQQLLKSQESEARERTAFLQDQLRAQQELGVIQERERQRQKKLTEELEHQKRIYDDDRLMQLRKEETLKAQERERQRQEEKRLELEKASEKQQEELRFHKIKPEVKPVIVVAVPVKPVVAPAPAVHAAPAVPAAPAAMTPKQLKEQADFSKERKAFLDNKYKKEQEEKAHQAKIKAREEARQKRIEEREAKIKAAADAKAALAKARAEKSAQEEKRKEELLRQQEQQREEKEKQDEIIRQEAQRRDEMERQERQRQAQLEAQRESVRKQLEDGVEAMYQDALRLFQQGQFTAAADRFKDVQDILPGYKRAEEYMNEARSKADVKPPTAASSDASLEPSNTSTQNVSKALDLFDPNAK